MKRDRRYWFTKDFRSELEQITFGEKIQSYVGDDEFQGQRVVSVLTYLDASGLGVHKADALAGAIVESRKRGELFGGYWPDIEKVVLHHYSTDRATVQRGIHHMEGYFLEALEQAREIEVPPPRIIIVMPPNDPFTS